jgi:hypothetical protein
MTRWGYPFVELAGDPLKKELSLRWVNIGMWNILFVPSARNLSWVTGIMRGKDWLTVRHIITNYLETSATLVTR